MNLRARALAALSAALLAGTAPSRAAEAPAQDGKDCFACHEAIARPAFVHGPVAARACDVCHTGEKPAGKRHTFSLVKPQPELCLGCHESFRAALRAKRVKHAALEAGGCTACHNPHASPRKFLLARAESEGLCAQCHDAQGSEPHVHPPVKTSCSLCHEPHGGDAPSLLKSAQPALCLSCHRKTTGELAQKSRHPPALAKCSACHQPHGGRHPRLLRNPAEGTAFCLACHKELAQRLRTAKRPHPAVESKGCLACHTPHGSAQAPLLKASADQLCLNCHAKMREELKSPFRHGPVELGQCSACHNPHGSDNARILKTFFPAEFYNSYKNGLYALCFNCHEQDIARDPKTVTLTNFRDGDRNLHYLHVHAQKGRSCKACHAVHASAQPKHVRSEVPFGSWMLPIRFQKTADGGRCDTGCHKPLGYSRAAKPAPK